MFSDEFWSAISRIVAETCRFSLDELERLRSNQTAKLIAAIPVLAGCTDADRIASQHVATYLLAEKAESIYDHRKGDDGSVYNRLERISHFPDGNRELIQRGMNLLVLTMISGYERSLVTDREQGVYNPVGSSSWDVEKEKARLVKAIRAIESPEMDAIFSIERALTGSWNS